MNITNDKKPGFLIYKDWYETLNMLTLKERGIILTNMYHLQLGLPLIEMNNLCAIVFSLVKIAFYNDYKKYEHICEVRRIAGSRGGRSKSSNCVHIDKDIDMDIDMEKDMDYTY